MRVVQDVPKQDEGQAAGHDDLCAALHTMQSRLDMLASINEPREPYHHLVEDAFAVLGWIETNMDMLRAELEYHHSRLDDLRDAALAVGNKAYRYPTNRRYYTHTQYLESRGVNALAHALHSQDERK